MTHPMRSQGSWQKIVRDRPGKQSVVELDMEMEQRCGAVMDVLQVLGKLGNWCSMLDNISLCQELSHKYGRCGISPRCTIKVDIQKAYDTVDWSFLEEVLRGLGYPNRFIDWLVACYTTPSFSLLLNGSLEDYFPSQRRLCQGDPLSPFLFVVAMEYLSRQFVILKSTHAFNFHPKCSRIGLTHLCFADDLMVFCRGDVPAVTSVVDDLRQFGLTPGLVMNPLKSSIYLGGVKDKVKVEILQVTSMVEGSLPTRYLGIPLHQRALFIVEYRPLLHALQKKVDNWATRKITYVGWRMLIEAVLGSIVQFWAGVLVLPSGLIAAVERVCRDFLRSGGSGG